MDKDNWCTAVAINREPKHRTYITLGQVVPANLYGVHDNNYQNGINAVVNRLFFNNEEPTIRPIPGAFRRLKEFKSRLASLVRTVSPLSDNQFLDCYSGRKRAVYVVAIESLKIRELSKADAFISAFIKAEKESFMIKMYRVPRLIQPRSPRYNVEVGKLIKPLERAIYRAIDELFGETTVAKHLNADTRAQVLRKKWDSMTDPVALLLDASRFDQHVSEEALCFEHSLYVQSVTEKEGLAKLLSWQRCNIGYLNTDDGRIKYKKRGTRCSGDMNTSLGNVALMCAMMWSFFNHMSIKIKLLNDGDDCVVLVERDQVSLVREHLPAYFVELGFKMRFDGVAEEFEHIDFCQARPVYTGSAWRMVRDPRVCRDKDDICTRGVVTEKEWDLQRGAVAGCGLALAGDMPIMGSMYSWLARGARIWRELTPTSGMDWLAIGMYNTREEPTAESRASFYKAFDITPDEQIALELDYDHKQPRWTTTGLPEGKIPKTEKYNNNNLRHQLQSGI